MKGRRKQQGKPARPEIEDLPQDAAKSEAAKGFVEWSKLKAKTGWTEPTIVSIMTDFLMARGMLTDLTKFAKTRSRK